eukprot:765518-Hanusia_phi.AAC.8
MQLQRSGPTERGRRKCSSPLKGPGAHGSLLPGGQGPARSSQRSFSSFLIAHIHIVYIERMSSLNHITAKDRLWLAPLNQPGSVLSVFFHLLVALT